METIVAAEVAALKRMTVKQLQHRYAELFGEATRGHNKVWLIKRIAWRMQALAEGELSDRARRRADELARDADLRTTLPMTRTPVISATSAESPPDPTPGRPPPASPPPTHWRRSVPTPRLPSPTLETRPKRKTVTSALQTPSRCRPSREGRNPRGSGEG